MVSVVGESLSSTGDDGYMRLFIHTTAYSVRLRWKLLILFLVVSIVMGLQSASSYSRRTLAILAHKRSLMDSSVS